jgi:hypothetical protein
MDMKRICIALALSLIALPAYAEAWKCKAFDRSKFPATAKLTTLSPGQVHFAQGAFTMIPPIGMPAGDGAMLIQITKNGKLVDGEPALVLFTSGKLGCQMMGIPSNFAKFLLKIGTGKTDSDGLEL